MADFKPPDGPRYYQRGSIEVWDFIRDQGLNYFKGNAIKYICRAGYKSPQTEIEDIKKAIHYLENELQHALSEDIAVRPSPAIPFRVRRPEWENELVDAEKFDR